MEHDSNYIKDVENYFLSLAGEGIMLSSMDYNLIMEWKNKEIPKEVVFKGINKAFEEFKAKEGQGAKSNRNLKRCASYIEKFIDEYSPIIGKQKVTSESTDYNLHLKIVLDKLNHSIKTEKNDVTKSYYKNMKDKLLAHISSIGDDAISQINQIEEECLNELFLSLPGSEKEGFNNEALSMLGSRIRQMTKEAIDESIVSFRNELLINKFGLKSVLTNEAIDG